MASSQTDRSEYFHTFAVSAALAGMVIALLSTGASIAGSPQLLRNVFTFTAGIGMALALPGIFLRSPSATGAGLTMILLGGGMYIFISLAWFT